MRGISWITSVIFLHSLSLYSHAFSLTLTLQIDRASTIEAISRVILLLLRLKLLDGNNHSRQFLGVKYRETAAHQGHRRDRIHLNASQQRGDLLHKVKSSSCALLRIRGDIVSILTHTSPGWRLTWPSAITKSISYFISGRVSVIQMGQATWSIWAAIKQFNLR